MTKIGKISLLIPAFILLILCLTGCSGTKDVPVPELIETVGKATDPGNETASANVDYITDLMGFDLSLCVDYQIRIPGSSVNMDEYGIFKTATEEDASTLQKQVDEYLELRNRQWMPEYLPQEYPKIKNAESERIGCYVMYAILGDGFREAAFNAFRSALK